MLKRNQHNAINSNTDKKYDVLVAGAGPAGFGAALAAARLGASTMLVEARGFPGGVASTSLWMPINRLKKNGGTRGGIHAMLVERLEKYGPNAYRDGKVTWTDGDGLHVHPEYLKLAMYELLEESGCHYLMHSPVTGAHVVIALVCLLPFLYVLSVSLTDPDVYIPYEFRLIPRKFSLRIYATILSTPDFLISLKNTVIITVGGTVLGVFTTFGFAYGLTKNDLPFRKLFMFLVLFGLLFDVGLIPNYMNIRSLGLLNTYWALILPAMATSYNVIIAKSFMKGIPGELEEAAIIDGCSYFRVYFQIVLPLSLASMATLTLFIAVDQWNMYIKPLMYISDHKLRTIQV